MLNDKEDMVYVWFMVFDANRTEVSLVKDYRVVAVDKSFNCFVCVRLGMARHVKYGSLIMFIN